MVEKHEGWEELFEEMAEVVAAWREAHPEATLTEKEEAIDSRLAEVRRQMVEDVAMAGRTADLAKLPEEERPRCPQCGKPVVANGKQRRRLTTEREQTIELERSKAYCAHCQVSFFPPG